MITGGAGFIGSNIARILLERGYRVYVLDDFFLGRRSNIRWLEARYRENIRVIEGSVLDPAILSRIMSKCHYVIHEAAYSSAPMFDSDPRQGINVNILGFSNVLEIARRSNIRKVVYASTSSLYGGFDPPHREDLPVSPRTFYEYTMFAREHIARIYYDAYGVRSVGMRYFSVYGPNELHKGRYANVVTQFLWCMLKNKQPVIYGDGTQTRDFIYVDDVAEATILAMENEDLACDVINVGTGVETSFNEVIRLLQDACSRDVTPIYVENPIRRYVYRTRADTAKAERILGFKAKVSVGEGVRKLVGIYSKIVDEIPEEW